MLQVNSHGFSNHEAHGTAQRLVLDESPSRLGQPLRDLVDAVDVAILEVRGLVREPCASRRFQTTQR